MAAPSRVRSEPAAMTHQDCAPPLPRTSSVCPYPMSAPRWEETGHEHGGAVDVWVKTGAALGCQHGDSAARLAGSVVRLRLRRSAGTRVPGSLNAVVSPVSTRPSFHSRGTVRLPQHRGRPHGPIPVPHFSGNVLCLLGSIFSIQISVYVRLHFPF